MAALVIELVNGELAGKTAQNLTKEIRAARLEADKATIGTQMWVDAHKNLDSANKRLGDYKNQVKSVTQASESMKQQFLGFLDRIPGFGAASSMVQNVTSSVGGLTGGFGLLKGAIISTGIGALVISLITLFDWFKKTDDGANFLAGAFKTLEIITDKLFSGIRKIPEYLSQPKQVLSDLGNFIKDQLINRITAMFTLFDAGKLLLQGEFSAAARKGLDSVIQLGLGVKDGTEKMGKMKDSFVDAAKAGQDYSNAIDKIEDRQRELNVLQAESEKTVTQLILQSKNVGLTYEERIALLDRAGKVELANHQQQLANAIALEKIVAQEVADKKATVGVNDELDKKYKDAQIARIKLDQESINLQEKISNRRTALSEKQLAEIDKFNEEYDKRQEAAAALQQQRDTADDTRQADHIKKQMVATVKALQEKTKAIATDAETQKTIQEGIDKIKSDSLQAFNAGTQSIIALLGADEAARKKNANTIKFFERSRVIVNGVAEVSALAKGFAELGPFAQVLAAIQIAASIARTAAGIKSIDAQKFEMGGIFRGPSHAHGGIPIEVEGDEIILTKGVGRDPFLRRLASNLNVAGGGRMFEAGGPTDPFIPSVTSSNRAAVGSLVDNSMVIQKLDQILQVVASWPVRLQVHNNVQDTLHGINVINTLKREADV
jgi:hypothetical protein